MTTNNNNGNVLIPSLQQLIDDLKSQEGYKAMLANVTDPKEKAVLERDVVKLMENYYSSVLKPLVS